MRPQTATCLLEGNKKYGEQLFECYRLSKINDIYLSEFKLIYYYNCCKKYLIKDNNVNIFVFNMDNLIKIFPNVKYINLFYKKFDEYYLNNLLEFVKNNANNLKLNQIKLWFDCFFEKAQIICPSYNKFFKVYDCEIHYNYNDTSLEVNLD